MTLFPSVIRLAAFITCFQLGACTSYINTHGHFVEPDDVKQIKIGQTSKEQVVSLLGTPGTVSPFDKNRWIYMARTTSTRSFFTPELLESQVLVVVFDANNRVGDIMMRDNKTEEDVSIVDRTTPTSEYSTGFLEQMFGNIGRFKAEAPK